MRPLALLLLLVACGRSESTSAPVVAPTAPAVREPVPTSPLLPCPTEVHNLGSGLAVERWPIAATPAAGGPPCIDVVRADTTRFTLRVLSAADEAGARSATGWRETFHLAAVTNAGMFHASGKPVGMIVTDGTLRSNDNTKMSGYLAWDPVNATDPPIQLAGRDCPDFDLAALRARYHSIVQSYRLLGCSGEALPWKDPKQYSAAAIGLDRAGRIVFLHARAAVTMAELSGSLATHDLVGALFLEGGPEASLVARGPDAELARVGSYETNFVENDSNQAFWNLPNVIALLPR
ncbi:MAG: phosphodiester glycosidase family protein [Deltaproteobacteria bacterium]|nr:phosphodiester glycosidase family protein [Deltaproteobacteria bacterium]